MKSIEFHRPVWVGDIVSFYTHVVQVGRTSLTMHVSVDTERDGTAVHLTDAEVTYVSIEGPPQDQRPVPIRGDTKPVPRRAAAQRSADVIASRESSRHRDRPTPRADPGASTRYPAAFRHGK